MISFWGYLWAQIKRIMRLFPGIMLMTVVLAMVVGGIGYAILNSESYREQGMRYQLGIVGSTQDDMLTMGVNLLENNDDSRFMLDIVRFDDEQEAKQALRDGRISAYVLITDDFIDSLNVLSSDMKLEYFATSGQRGITSVMMDELADIASRLVVSSEKGLLVLEEEMRNAGFPSESINSEIDKLLLLYVGAMLARGDMAEYVELGLSDGLSTKDYYTITMSLFFVLLLSFCSVSFFLGRNRAGYQFIAGKGLSPAKQVMAEYIAYLLLNGICVALVYSIIRIFIKCNFNIVFSIILFTSMGFFVYEAIDGVINKLLATFILYITMSYISGYFYPRNFFPDMLQTLGRIFPTGVAFECLEGISGSGLKMLIYTVAFLFASIMIRGHKVK